MPSSYNLGSHYEDFVRELVRSGRYASASEVMRDSLRLLEEKEARRQARLAALRAEISTGIHSGPAVSADQVFDRLQAKYRSDPPER